MARLKKRAVQSALRLKASVLRKMKDSSPSFEHAVSMGSLVNLEAELIVKYYLLL